VSDTLEDAWEAPVLFVQHVCCLLMFKNTLPSCLSMPCHILFMLVRCVSPVIVQFVPGGLFFYFLFSLLSWNYKLALLVINISTSVQFFLFLIFSFGSFIEILFIFNFIIQSQFTRYYILQFHPYSLDFYFFIGLL
jgi:hypothetical protein